MQVFKDIAKELRSLMRKLLCYEKYTLVFTGTELRSDDKVALYIYDRLRSLGIKGIIKCEYGLENCIDRLRNVTKMLLVDAVLLRNLNPGNVVLCDLDEISDETLITTHAIPLNHIIKLLRIVGSLRDVRVLGIRVKNLEIGNELSPEIRTVAESLIKILSDTLSSCYSQR